MRLIRRGPSVCAAGLLLAAALLLVPAVPAFAAESKDYTIEAAWWNENDSGRMQAEWDKPEGSTNYKVALYRNNTTKAIKSWTLVTTNHYDFSAAIAKKGTGTYYYEVYPVKGGESMVVVSDEYEVDSEDLKLIKEYAKHQKEEEEASSSRGWIKAPDGTWRYYKDDGMKLKNDWLDYEGARYHFSSNGIMQTGWQAIGGKWYYFSTDLSTIGMLVTSGTTPDGKQVDETGAWIEEGKTVSAAGVKTSPPVKTALSKTSIGVNEKNADPGVLKEVQFTAGTGISVDSVSYSVDPSAWEPGTPVLVTAVISVTNNYSFANDLKVTVRGAKSVSVEGSGTSRIVRFDYYPKTTLAAPSVFYYIPEEEQLFWNKVDGAERYKVVFYNGSSQVSTQTVERNTFDIGEFMESDEYDDLLNVKIYATSTSGKSGYILTSQAGSIPDLTEFMETRAIEGELRYMGQNLIYNGTDGERVKDAWVQLGGDWYHFDRGNGYAAKGWFQDSDGLWYYFDQTCRMVTGTVTEGDKSYFLNDGSRTDLPYGAWVE